VGARGVAQRRATLGEVVDRVEETTVGLARAREELAVRVANAADGVHDNERRDNHVARSLRPRSDAALHRVLHPGGFADGAARAGADRPFGDVGPRGVAGARRVVGGGPARLPATAEIEDDRGGYDRHDAGGTDGETAAALAQPAHHAVRRAEAVRRPAGEEDGMDALDQVAGVERVDLARS